MGCLTLVCIACVVIPVAAGENTTATPTATPTTTATTVAPTTTVTTATPTTTATTVVPTTTVTTATPTTTATTVTPLVATFTASPISGTAPLTVQFTDTSTGSPTKWDWNFGDGDSSTNENPSYAYTTAGTYTVTLTIGDGGVLPSSTSIQTTTITVNAGATAVPVVTGVSPTYGPVSTSTAIIITGTGFTGATGVTVGGVTATNVVVVSSTEITATTPATSTAGQVDVLVTTPSGTSSSVAGDEYTFAESATTIPVPIFIASPTSGTAPLEVTFTDESTGSPASWSWDFGDGNTSTLENPTYTYANDGTYSVTLTEDNSLGTNATTMTGYVVVGSTAPVASFTESYTTGAAPLTVQFTDQSTESPTLWEWSFGDGSTGTAENPSHTYTAAGTYTVTLTATNTEGSSTNTASQTISVGSGAATPIPTTVFTTVPTFAVGAEATTTSSVDSWLA